MVGLVRKSTSEREIQKIRALCTFLRHDLSFYYVSLKKIIEIFEHVRLVNAKKVFVQNIFSLALVESELVTLSVLLQEEGIQFYDIAGKILIEDDFFMTDSPIKAKLQSGAIG